MKCNQMINSRLFVVYLGDRLRAGGGCEAAMIARTWCGWVKFRECIELLYC